MMAAGENQKNAPICPACAFLAKGEKYCSELCKEAGAG